MKKVSEVTDPEEIKAIWEARNIGRLLYPKIEEKFGLQPASGMSALLICKRHERLVAATIKETPA